MLTTVTIGGVDYPANALTSGVGVFDLQLRISVEEEWSLEFSAMKCGAAPPFVPGLAVTLTTTDDDGSNPAVRFVGDVGRPEVRSTQYGYGWAYTCTDLKHRAQWVPLTATDGSGTASYNLPADDVLSLYTLTGQTVGQIVTSVLQGAGNAAALAAVGVGAYTTLTPPTLPSLTVADLANLTVVPVEPVQLQGTSILNTLEEFVARYHPQYACWVRPDGVIRFASIFGFTPRTLTVPTGGTAGDDIDWPEYAGPDCTGCFTAYQITGLDIEPVQLSLVDNTLSPAWTTASQNAWTILDFEQPKEAADEGTASSVTSTTCTVASDHSATNWAANWWQAQEGWIYLFNPGGLALGMAESRRITACTALSAGGSASITWDSSTPLSSSSYTRYRIVGRGTPKALVSRDFHIREPARSATPTGNDLDRNTYVGSHLYPRFPKGTWVGPTSGEYQIFYAQATIRWSQTGAYPWFEETVRVQANPNTGHILLAEPAVSKFGDRATLLSKYPTTTAQGLPHDIVVTVPVNRGGLIARAPSTGYSGTAYTAYGIQRTCLIPMDNFVFKGDKPALDLLCQQHLECYRDAVLTGSVTHHGIPAGFDPFTLPYSLNVVTPGQATPLDGINLPVRSTLIRWPNDGADIHAVGFGFSNLRRPFQGDNQYLHPAFAAGGFGMGDGVFVGGIIGGSYGGMMSDGDFNLLSAESGGDLLAGMSSDPIADSLRPGSSDPLGDIAANHANLGSELFAQAHPGDAFAAQADATNAGLDARNAPIADAMQQQAMAARDGDPFGVMEGFSPGRSPQPSQQSAAGRQQAETQGRVDAREAAQEQAARTAQQARQPTPRSERVDTGEARAAEGRDAPVDPMHPQSIMNMAPDPDKAGFGAPINPDASNYPLSIANEPTIAPKLGTPINPEKRTPRPRGPGLARKRGELPDDDTQMGGGG